MATNQVDRIELNNRFKMVFRLLTIHGKIVKNHRKLSKSAFAKNLRTRGHIIDKYLQNQRTITYAQTKRLCQVYGISEAYMFQGVGLPFKKQTLAEGSNPTPMVSNDESVQYNSKKAEKSMRANILFTNIKAFASDALCMETGEYNEMFHIPGLQGDFVAFNISGDSMEPTVNHGDMVICTALTELSDLDENEIYAVITSNAVRVKRLKKVNDDCGKWTHLKLISDNFLEYDPFVIPVKEVRQIFKVVKRLTGLGES